MNKKTNQKLIRTTISLPEHLREKAEKLAEMSIFGTSVTSASDVYRFCLENNISLETLYQEKTQAA